jgi:hypothetical protein
MVASQIAEFISPEEFVAMLTPEQKQGLLQGLHQVIEAGADAYERERLEVIYHALLQDEHDSSE